jgi:hypothetical protein
VIERGSGAFEESDLEELAVEIGFVGRAMVMGEDAIARFAASAVSKMARMGRLWIGEVLLVSY